MNLIELNKIFGKGLNFKKVSEITGIVTAFTIDLVGHDTITVITAKDKFHVSCNFGRAVHSKTKYFNDEFHAINQIRNLFRCSVDNLFTALQKEDSEISYKEYMKDASNLHTDFYVQFATRYTIRAILEEVGMEALRASEDEHLNDVKIPFNNIGGGGSWWWSTLAYNQKLLIEKGGDLALSTRTCIAKSTAKFLLQKDSEEVQLFKLLPIERG